MKKSLLIAACATLVVFAGCKDKKNMDNPFFSAWETPYGIVHKLVSLYCDFFISFLNFFSVFFLIF